MPHVKSGKKNKRKDNKQGKNYKIERLWIKGKNYKHRNQSKNCRNKNKIGITNSKETFELRKSVSE